MSTEQDAIKLYSSSDEEEEGESKYDDWAVVPHVLGYPPSAAAQDRDDDSEDEEKASSPSPARKRSQQERIVTDASTVPTRAQQLQKQHRPRSQNTPWPTRLSRATRHRAKRAPVRYGDAVLYARVAPAAAVDRQLYGRSRDSPRLHGGL
ncbi:hypothetical protein PF005_g1946 [Phytophthora fragariae]|uniref:Uncharacterized protein n=1 Tax=Phytophthora fragariae TaxID=53985 RepID=A0A6A3M888_9STRA|nr:hypothetical protein PF003_g9906 [Phytophthora fragariae]KAE8948538.1 hypothetical protein PF009_g1910 [Phytophthora fragariae]KAE9028239.1 hypothetical protein PF011_g1658 [Phytophthora fragariae]KAE9106462.1 hypothetical protein PF010_g12624 [Phytophthora fragariae]KAE9122653.1 hypothetical protein PF007_g7370 [Phytophthora fragariae]